MVDVAVAAETGVVLEVALVTTGLVKRNPEGPELAGVVVVEVGAKLNTGFGS